MPRADWRGRVRLDPAIHHGDPCIVGTRIPISIIVGSVADGLTVQQIISEYPQLREEDIGAALAYAAEVLRYESIMPLPD